MPIRLLHFADLHLGVENYGRLNPRTGLNSRFEDFVDALNCVVQYAIDRPVDLVIFAGDAYKNRDPSPTHQRTFAQAIHHLSAARIPTVVLVGNHDAPNTTGRAHAVEVFEVLDVPHVWIADSPGVRRIETRSGTVQVAALPYRRASAIAQQPEHRGKTSAELATAIVADYEQKIVTLGESLDRDLPTVLTAHLCVGGSLVSSERSLVLSDEPMVPLSTLIPAGLPLDYVALGHIHKFQDLNPRGYPPVVYPGSLERVDFGEEEDEKGFVLVDLDRGKTTYQFVAMEARRFVTIECDLDSDDPMGSLEAAVRKVDVEGAVVRLRYRVPEEKRVQLTAAGIHRLLSRSFCVGRVEREIVRSGLRSRDPQLTESLDIVGALQRYIDVKEIKVDRERMLGYGRTLVEELRREEAAET